MKKECLPVMGFRHSHIGINFTSKRIYIYIYMYINIQVEFHLIQNLNPIGIKISNQFRCCYLINLIKSGLKRRSYEQKEKRKKNLWKKGNFSFIAKKKNFFLRRTNTYYIQILFFFFFEKKEKVFTLNSNIYYLIYKIF